MRFFLKIFIPRSINDKAQYCNIVAASTKKAYLPTPTRVFAPYNATTILGRFYKLGRDDFEEYFEEISQLSQRRNASIVTAQR